MYNSIPTYFMKTNAVKISAFIQYIILYYTICHLFKNEFKLTYWEHDGCVNELLLLCGGEKLGQVFFFF